jgi:2-polyprenyl-3-methyl-5-hydroxy-6-metoxy-1,4-benzoquinol methylase
MQYSIKNRQASNISSYEINEEWNGYLESRIQAMDLYVKKRFNFAEKLFIGEVGCLEGTLLKKLADDGNEVLVFEINTEVVKRSNSLYSLSIYDKNIEIDDFSAHRGALDCILSFHTFEHLKSPRVALSQCASMLKIGGGILIEVPCDDDELDNPEHFHFFNPSTLRKLLEEYFTNVEIHRNSYFRNGEYELGSIYGSGIKK